MSKATYFDPDWIDKSLNPGWASWLQEVNGDKTKAKCVLCRKTFSLSNMGSVAVKSHEKSLKHRKFTVSDNGSQMKLTNFFNSTSSSEKQVQPDNCTSPLSSSHSNPDSSNNNSKDEQIQSTSSSVDVSNKQSSVFFVQEEVTKAEISWALNVSYKHYSYNSCTDIRQIFQKMFPDSKIAENFTLGRTKCSYNITYGLAPYFHGFVHDSLLKSDYIVACFDESLNVVIQKGQMDLCVRYWDANRSQATTRYFDSAFLGHATADDLQKSFTGLLKDHLLPKVIQVSMDGPNVNFKFSSQLIDELDLKFDSSLLDMGCCGLHVVHGAFQNGHKNTNWKVTTTLRSFYKLFHDSPARRADFENISGSSIFPMKFCATRWVENVKPAQRALDIYENIKTYVGQSKLPCNFTVNAVKEAINDVLLPAKLSFFQYVASIVEPFLRFFQSDMPLSPFLYEELSKLIHSLMEKCIKADVLRENMSVQKKMKLDLQANKAHYKNVKIGIATTSILNKLKTTEGKKIEFRKECLDFFIGIIQKSRERCPLKYKLTRAISSLNPNFILSNPSIAKKRITDLMTLLYESKRIDVKTSDPADLQFHDLCSQATGMPEFKKFDFYHDRLDDFYVKIFADKTQFKELFEIVKFVCILSHGNATVESGFSINSDVIVENLLERSVVAQRQVYDAVIYSGSVLKVDITKSMMKSVNMSHSRYQDDLKRNREKRSEEETRKAEKQQAQMKIKELEAKKSRINNSFQHDIREMDEEMKMLKRKLRDN